MTCPICGGDTGVTCTRSDCESVYRRRECLGCGHKFYTTELESGSDDFNRLDKIARDKYKEKQKNRRKQSLQKTVDLPKKRSLRETVNLLERNRSRSED